MISRHIPAEDESVNLHHKHSLVDALVPTFCARGFIEGCSYKSLLKSWGMGLDPLIPREKVRCRKACRARPDRVRFAPFVRVRTTWNCRVADPTWKKIESSHGNYAANARQVLLPAGDRSLIEACLACELHLKVVWHGWTAWAEWKCLFSCQFYNSARLQDGQFPWHFSQGPASTIPVLEIKPSDGRWWQTDEKDETDNWHQVTSLATSLASPQATLTSARWTRVISCA